MSNGQGCTCNAWSENECACGADWTPQEVYDLRAENDRLKAELKSIDGALDDPRANLTLTTAEIIWEMKAELAEAKKDAERYRYFCEHLDDTDQTNPLHILMAAIGSRAPTKQELDAAIDDVIDAMKGK